MLSHVEPTFVPSHPLAVSGTTTLLTDPSPALRGLVLGYETVTPPSAVPVLRDWGRIDLVESGEGLRCIVRGPEAEARVAVPVAGLRLSIRLSPLGWHHFIGADASKLVDQAAALALVNARLDTAFQAQFAGAVPKEDRAAIADALLLRVHAARAWSKDLATIARLAHLFDDPDLDRIDTLCGMLHMEHARLARLCRRAFGFPPKYLLRRQRLKAMVAVLEERPYSEWRQFLDPRYVDQSHFIRDFRDFYGMAPSHYLQGR